MYLPARATCLIYKMTFPRQPRRHALRRLVTANCRSTLGGHRGERVGEASHPGPRHNVPNIREAERDSARSKMYTWHGDDFAHGRLQAGTMDDVLFINTTSVSAEAQEYVQKIGSEVVGVVTKGDGACGIHAVFGGPSAQGLLYKAGARRLAACLLGPDPQALREGGVEEKYIAAIGNSFWYEFVKPTLEKRPEAQSADSSLFWTALQKMMPDLVHECTSCHSDYERCTKTRGDARILVMNASPSFSMLEMEECFVRPLATSRGLLPPGIELHRLHDIRYIMELQKEHPTSSEWLESAFDATGFIRASKPRVLFPQGGPSCKYMALFEANIAYDGLRQAFIEGTDGSCHQCQELLVHLIQVVTEEGTRPTQFMTRALDLNEKMHTYEKANKRLQSVNTVPPEFASRAWQVYLSCVQNTAYYFSIEELMVMCKSAQVNVLLFHERRI